MRKYLIFLILVPFVLSARSCTNGENFCEKCNPITNKCVICQNDVLKPDSEGGCVGYKKCIFGKNYCEICNDESTLCQLCPNGFYPDENGGCSYVANCLISNNGACLACKDGFILIGKNEDFKICKSLYLEDFLNCKSIDYSTGLCETCEENYYLNRGDKRCIKTDNCFSSSFGQCTECNPSFYLDLEDNRKCKFNSEEFKFKHCKESEDGENCSKCEEGFYLAKNEICVLTNFCEIGKDECEKCIDGYYLGADKKSCTTDENCFSGDNDLGICIQCDDNFYLDLGDGQCKSNQEDNDLKYCIMFSDTCTECLEYYYLGEDKKCTNTKGCAKSEFGVCQKCSENYFLGKDFKCSNIEHCIYSSSSNCYECEDGYYYNKFLGKCFVAEGKYENCKISSYVYDCLECKDDYYLLPPENLCLSNKEDGPLYKCAKASYNATECEKCIKGYYKGSIDYKCSSIDFCASSENDECLECEDTYCLNAKSGKCEDNDFIVSEEKKFLFKCKKTNKKGTACEVCVDNYTLTENGLCVDEIHCEEKVDGTCVKCIDEDEYAYYCLNKEFGCIPYSLSNCLRCENILYFESCTQCQEGYQIGEYGQCLEDKTI